MIECAYYKACKEGHLEVVKLLDDHITHMTRNERQSNKPYDCVQRAFMKLLGAYVTNSDEPIGFSLGCLIAAYKGHTNVIDYLYVTLRLAKVATQTTVTFLVGTRKIQIEAFSNFQSDQLLVRICLFSKDYFLKLNGQSMSIL